MSWEDLTAGVQRTCVSTFAVTDHVQYHPQDAADFEVDGIFRDQAQDVTVATAELATVNPVVHLRLGDLAVEPRDGDEVTIRGIRYRVWEPAPDGEGMVELSLRLIP